MRYLIFDIETNGIDKDKDNGYRPYPDESKPLPRENYPVEIGMCLIENDGAIVDTLKIIIQGAERLCPWVEENCQNVSLKTCEREGITFGDALSKMADMIGDEPCTLVAHNIQYDWDDVIVVTAKELNLTENNSYLKLKKCPQYCTCINDHTKKNRSAYYHKKLHKWIGPNLSNLAKKYDVKYDTCAAHDALYDVEITRECFVKSVIEISK
tara:strand:+ start:1173 stop:1805 length:633 start_codon:yes stop_codon:yes gene_type:complete